MAPTGGSVTLDDFSFVGRAWSIGDRANLELQAFVLDWSGNLIGKGGGATGPALYLGAPMEFSLTSDWTLLTANLGSMGVSLTPGDHYVLGFNVWDSYDSQGVVEFQGAASRNWYPTIPASVDGGGGAVWNKDPAALTTSPWSTIGDEGDYAFQADFTVPETGGPTVYVLAAAALIAFARWRQR